MTGNRVCQNHMVQIDDSEAVLASSRVYWRSDHWQISNGLVGSDMADTQENFTRVLT